jgi:DNA polymerase-3 subunit gamma/tau
VTERPASDVSLQQVRDAWPEILESVQRRKMSAWTVAYTARVRSLDDDVLGLAFMSQKDADAFRGPQAPGEGASELLRAAILEVLGIRVKFTARIDAGPDTATPGPTPEPSSAASPAPDAAANPEPSAAPTPASKAAPDPKPNPAPSAAPKAVRKAAPPAADSGAAGGWAVVTIPGSNAALAAEEQPGAEQLPESEAHPAAEPESQRATKTKPQPKSQPQADTQTQPQSDRDPAQRGARASVTASSKPEAQRPAEPRRYGEAVVREVLGATFIEEQTVQPRVKPAASE